MELLIELIFELILEGSTEVAKNKKISKWIRYPIAMILILFITAILSLLIFLGFELIFQEDKFAILGGIFFLIISIIFIISLIRNIRKELKIEKNDGGNL